MSRSITQTSSSSSAVAAGSSVIVPVNTTTGFSAGDYVYTLPSGGVGTRATGNVIVGLDTPYVGTTWINTGIQSSSFRSASYGPLIDQATYSGTTRSIGTQTVASSTILATASTGYTRSCTLANGNVVQMYSEGSNLYFRIVDTVGTVVVAPITLTTSLYTSSNVGGFACCTLVSGNIQFIYNVGIANRCDTAQYSPAGSVVVAGTSTYTGVSQLGNLSMAALSGGGSIVCGSSGYTGNIATPQCVQLSASGGYVTNFAGNGGPSGGYSNNVQVIGLPSSYGTNIWMYYAQDTFTQSGYYPIIYYYSGSTYISSIQNNYSGQTGVSAGIFIPTFTTDGYIVFVTWYGSAYATKYLYTKTSNTSGTMTYVGSSYIDVSGGNSTTLSATSSGNIIAVGVEGGGPIFITRGTTTGSSFSWSSGVQIGSNLAVSSSPWLGKVACSTSGGVAVIHYIANTTNYVDTVTAASSALTNGSTVLQGASYLPSGGYYLMGVAATDAAANQTGQVIVNGTAQLGSAYPTVTTPIYYSYQTTASQPIFGQRGSVSATTVTLKGLEA